MERLADFREDLKNRKREFAIKVKTKNQHFPDYKELANFIQWERDLDATLLDQAKLEETFESQMVVAEAMDPEQVCLFVLSGIWKHACVIYREMETSPLSQPINTCIHI